jgi:hypothetical protein
MKARLSTLQSELSLAQLRLSDSESEKNLYFTKLAQVDQYLSEALSQGSGETLPQRSPLACNRFRQLLSKMSQGRAWSRQGRHMAAAVM